MRPRQKEINEFLSSRRGLAYLQMKYPNLSVQQAISEYKNSVMLKLSYRTKNFLWGLLFTLLIILLVYSFMLVFC